jgi:2OG-Fe(II) oxygenase superfamily
MCGVRHSPGMIVATKAPFCIGAQGVAILEDPAVLRARFNEVPAIAFTGIFDPDFAAKMEQRAAATDFAEEYVDRIGSRMIEQPQRVGKALSLLLHTSALLEWLEQATGAAPLRAVAGMLVETRMNGRDALDWHDDREDDRRRLAVVINLSDKGFTGGQFQMRRKGEVQPVLTFDHRGVGSMLIFAVRPDLEHCVTPLSSGGPRRVYAGWFLSQPEFPSGTL